jgi:hypothetical protein
MPDSQEIIISIDKRLAEARDEIASLEAALSAIGKSSGTEAALSAIGKSSGTEAALSAIGKSSGTEATATSAPPPGANGAAPSVRGRRGKPRRQAEVVPAGKLEALLVARDGMATGDLVAQTGGDRQQVLTLLRELEAAGRVRRTGQRRGTLWHAITDEDRIAARVAQLERQRSRPTA